MDAADSSLMIVEDSMYMDDLDESMASSRSLCSPGTSPGRKSRTRDPGNSKVRMKNDQGKVRLTLKMREKEQEIRKFLSI